MHKQWMLLVCGLAVAFLGSPAYGWGVIPDYDFDWVTIGDPGNPAYEGGPYVGTWAGRGGVDYRYRTSRLEVTSAQWLEFINIFAPQSDQPLLFLRPTFSGIHKVPGAPAGVYELHPGIKNAAMVPVHGITWRDAAMFVNWLHNDKSPKWEAIMSGAYDASTFGYNPDWTFTDQLTHSPDAKFWIPTIDEWLKAAHYDPNRYGPGRPGWWVYSNTSDQELIPGVPGVGQTSAGQFDSRIPSWQIPLGSYPDMQSPWGLLDLSGGAAEWVEEVNYIDVGPFERFLDGSWAGSPNESLDMDAIYITNIFNPTFSVWGGLRVVSAVPGPGALGLLVVAVLFFPRRVRKGDTRCASDIRY